jgi:pilus assembly protein CpaC
MKKSTAIVITLLGLFVFAIVPAIGISQSTGQLPRSEAKPAQDQKIVETVPPVLPEPISEGAVQVFVGKSVFVSSPSPYKGCAITNTEIATANIITKNQVLLNGLKAGNTTLLCYDHREDNMPVTAHSYDVQVRIDLEPLRSTLKRHFPEEPIQVNPAASSLVLSGTVSSPAVSARVEALAKTESAPIVNMLKTPNASDMGLSSLRDTMKRVFPKENIQVDFSGGALVLYGTVSSPETAARAEALAKTESKDVVNTLRTPHISDMVMLRVRFAEIERSAIQNLGINLFGSGANITGGASATEKNFSGGAGLLGSGTTPGSTFSDVFNISLIRKDIDLEAFIKALEQRSLAQILAEPNLLALSGKEASFLAGGEIPIPIAQGGSGNTTSVTVLWKEFGVRLKFTADVLQDDMINVKIAPEVSALDYTHAIRLPGADDPIPALVTRKAQTEVELLNGQSFAIAGLIDNRLTELVNKIPGIGDIPILGNLFKTRSMNRTNTELVVLVTPQLMKPLSADQLPSTPSFPLEFLDNKKFDGKTGKVTAPKNAKKP